MELLNVIPALGGFVWTVVFFVIALSIIVFVHEYGHYIVGRWSGIHAEVFSIGFGPVLVTVRIAVVVVHPNSHGQRVPDLTFPWYRCCYCCCCDKNGWRAQIWLDLGCGWGGR